MFVLLVHQLSVQSDPVLSCSRIGWEAAGGQIQARASWQSEASFARKRREREREGKREEDVCFSVFFALNEDGLSFT